MKTIICPRCQTAASADVEEGQRVECGYCHLKFEAYAAITSAPKQGPKRTLPWRKIAVVTSVIASGVAVFGALVVWIAKYAAQLGPIASGVSGLLIILAVTVVGLLWITFPVFVYVYLRQIRDSLRTIAARGRTP